VNPIDKFKTLLEEIFQFEAADLDFGIYRILNFKRDQIRKFIHEDLVDAVEQAFTKHKDEKLGNIGERLDEIRQKIIETLGSSAILPSGVLKSEFCETPLGREYLNLKAQKDEAETIDEIKLQVFNDVYSFFSRYYQEGDFVPQYRYSIRNHKYAIPYDGEEVKLYWANSDQYYTKTGILFRDYAFFTDSAKTFKVIFRTVAAKEELGSNKATKARFFVLDDATPCEIIKGATLVIRLQYRELTTDEVKRYGVEGGSNTAKQEKLNGALCDSVISSIKDVALKGFLQTIYKNDASLLLYQLSRFTAKNTKDYFIHKNLRGFLSDQLDYFIKAEVISLETLEKEKFFDKHITRAKVVQEIGEKIIDFLAQIEDFQKRLWEKKKFVLTTEYVITTDMVPEEFYPDILKNKAQQKEWKELGLEAVKSSDELKEKKMPIDTQHFPPDFKNRLLEQLTEAADLDDLLDGLVIKSENWQGLNLLANRFNEEVRTIYIDPPFNKAQDAEYFYSVNYKDSTWVSLLQNRIMISKDFLCTKGNFFLRCNYEGNMLSRLLLDIVFGPSNFRNEIIVRRAEQSKGEFIKQFKGMKSMTVNYDNLYWYSADQTMRMEKISKPASEKESGAHWHSFWKAEDRPKMRYEILGIDLSQRKSGQWMWKSKRAFAAVENYNTYLKQCKEVGETLEEYWLRTGKKLEFIKREGDGISSIKYWIPPRSFVIADNSWLDIKGYANRWGFKTENSEPLLRRVVEDLTPEKDIVLDYFLGSGTTAATAHKLGRKWIGIESGNHIYSVVLPRMKSVLNGEKSGVSKEVKWGGGGIFKFQALEQYEDALDNIEVKPNGKAHSLFGEDYLLKYFLDFETRDAPSLVNIDCLKNPFSYKLKVNMEEVGEPQEVAVDIPETFNYLLGLKVRKIKVRKHKDKAYRFILGEKDGRTIAVVWREYDATWTKADFAADRDFIVGEIGSWAPAIVYINGQSVLTPDLGDYSVEIRQIEPEFKTLMDSGS
jgi:adenine-specific DNA-methyltransferase